MNWLQYGHSLPAGGPHDCWDWGSLCSDGIAKANAGGAVTGKRNSRKHVAKAFQYLIERLENRRLLNAVISPFWGAEPKSRDLLGRLDNPAVILIFWGSWWGGDNTPKANQIVNDTTLVCNSAYFSETAQYMGGPALNSTVYVSTDRAYVSSDPASNITMDQVNSIVGQVVNDGEVGDYSNGEYEVVTPPGVFIPGAYGENTKFFDSTNLNHFHFLNDDWVATSSGDATSPISDDFYTRVMSHETAEAMTDPGGTGIEFNPPPEFAGPDHQICDGEPNNNYTYREPDGAVVQAMWSSADQAWVVADGNTQNFYLSPNWNGPNFLGSYQISLYGDQLGANYNDVFSLNFNSGTGAFGFTENGQTENWPAFKMTHIYVNTGGGANTVNVYGNSAAVTTEIESDGGQDFVDIGLGNTQNVQGSILLDDFANLTVINIDDSADTLAQTVTITSSQVDLPSLTVYYGVGVAQLNVTTGQSVDVAGVYVYSTSIPTNLDSGGGNDNVYVGHNDSVSGIQAALTVDNTLAFSNLYIYDDADGTARSVTLGTGSISGLAPANIYYGVFDLSLLSIYGGSGGNTFYVTDNPRSGTTYLRPGIANFLNNTVFVTRTSSPLSIDSGGGYADIYVGLANAQATSGSLANIAAQLDVYDTYMSGGESLYINDSLDGTARTGSLNPDYLSWTAYAATVIWSASATSTGGVTSVSITGGSGGNIFSVINTTAIYTGFYLNSGSGSDTINVLGTAQASALNIQGLNGHDTVNVTNAGSVQGVLGAVNVENTGAYTALTIDDSADNTARNVTLDALVPNGDSPWGSIAGLAPGTISYESADVTSPVVLDGGGGGNTFTITNTPSGSGTATNLNCGAGADHVNVQGTGGGTTLNVEGEGGADIVNVGNNSSVQGILGTVNITNAPAFSTVTIDDSADISPQTATLSTFTPANDSAFGRVSGLSPGTINYRYNDVSSPITIDGGRAGNTFTVAATAPALTTVLNTGLGNDAINVNATTASSTLTINGQAGNDTINLDYTSGNPLPHLVNLNGLFTLNGLKGGNALNGTTLNIGRSTVFVSYSGSDPIATIQGYLKAGYNGGGWNGTPTAMTGVITSAAAQANANHNTAIGYADWADGTGINTMPNTIQLKYTLTGDANLDGQVNSPDLQRLLFTFNTTGAWDQGDFNYDGIVNSADLQPLLFNFNTMLGNQATPMAIAATPAGTNTSRDPPQLLPTIQAKGSTDFVHHLHPAKKQR
jgi:hypothetical protein